MCVCVSFPIEKLKDRLTYKPHGKYTLQLTHAHRHTHTHTHTHKHKHKHKHKHAHAHTHTQHFRYSCHRNKHWHKPYMVICGLICMVCGARVCVCVCVCVL